MRQIPDGGQWSEPALAIDAPIFTRQSRCYLYLHSLLPPHLSRAQSNNPPGRRSCHPSSIARLRFPIIPAGLRSSSREPVNAFPCPVAPPFLSLTCVQVPVSLRSSPVRGYLPPSTCLHHPHTPPPPLPESTGGPVPCRSPVVDVGWSVQEDRYQGYRENVRGSTSMEVVAEDRQIQTHTRGI